MKSNGSAKSTIAKDSLVVGFALFAMFFGAGNLIFPPSLGMNSGDQWWLGLLGFLLMDAVLACAGVFIISYIGGPRKAFEGAVGPRWALALNAVAILCLCVFFAMPRTAATTFELSVAPYLPDYPPFLLPIFAVIFFVMVFFLSVRESRVVDIVGKFFTPTLLVGILVVIVSGIIHPLGEIQAPIAPYVFEEGIRAGYQTMDVLGASAFALIVLDSSIVKAHQNRNQKLLVIGKACVYAVIMLALVYGGLSYLGASASGIGENFSQVQLLVALVQTLLGPAGMVLLSIVVFLACITTAVALVSSAADFFGGVLKGSVSYPVLAAIDCVIGAVICAVGLDAIIRYANPVLAVVYPPFITLVVMLLFDRWIPSKCVYKGAVLAAFLSAFVLELGELGVLPFVKFDEVPLAHLGFGWLSFALGGGVLGWAWGRMKTVKYSRPALSIILAFLMVATFVPTTAFASLSSAYFNRGSGAQLLAQAAEAPAIQDPDEFVTTTPAMDIPVPILVTFEANNGTGRYSTALSYTGNLSLPTAESLGFEAPDRGHFVGWSIDASGVKSVYAPGQLFPDNGTHAARLKKDVTLTAVWYYGQFSGQNARANFTIRTDGLVPFEPNSIGGNSFVPSGTASETLQGKLYQAISITNNPEVAAANVAVAPSEDAIVQALAKSGVNFNPGPQQIIWYQDKVNNPNIPTFTVNGIIAPTGSYLVTYNPNGGNSIVPPGQAYYPGEQVKVAYTANGKKPQRLGFTFEGWSKNPEASVPAYVDGAPGVFTMPNGPTTLYAVWKATEATVTYEVMAPKAKSADYADALTVTSESIDIAPGQATGSQARNFSDYVFTGWYKADQLIYSKPDLPEIVATAYLNRQSGLAEDTTYVARYTNDPDEIAQLPSNPDQPSQPSVGPGGTTDSGLSGSGGSSEGGSTAIVPGTSGAGSSASGTAGTSLGPNGPGANATNAGANGAAAAGGSGANPGTNPVLNAVSNAAKNLTEALPQTDDSSPNPIVVAASAGAAISLGVLVVGRIEQAKRAETSLASRPNGRIEAVERDEKTGRLRNSRGNNFRK